MNTKRIFFFGVAACLILSTCKNSTDSIPIIDIVATRQETKEIRLSAMANEIEYVKLETTPESRVKSGKSNKVLVGKEVIIYGTARAKKLVVFSRGGKFLHTISDNKNQAAGQTSISSWDLSTNDDKVLVQSGLNLKLYTPDGKIIAENELPAGSYSGVYFHARKFIVAIKDFSTLPGNACQLLILNDHLIPIDSLFQLDSISREMGQEWYHQSLAARANDDFLLCKPNSDTLYRLTKDCRIEPYLVFDLKQFQSPNRKLDDKEVNNYLHIQTLIKVNEYLLFNMSGNTTEYDSISGDWDEEYLVYNAKAKSSHLLRRFESPNLMNRTTRLAGIYDDLDGIGNFSESSIKDNMGITLQKIGSLRERVDLLERTGYKLNTTKYIDELKELLSSSRLNDNPILRIVHFEKDKVRHGKSRNPDEILSKYEEPTLEDGNMINLNDGWELSGDYGGGGPAGSSGLTFDPTDNTLWIMDFFDRYVYHYNVAGHYLPDGFPVDSLRGEGITYDSTDGSFWIIDINGNDVEHVTKQGVTLGDGFPVGKYGVKVGLGIAYDTSDKTLWVVTESGQSLYHFDKSGNLLPDGFSLKGIPSKRPAGMFFDSRDNTLWVVDNTPSVYHLSRKGELLNDGFSLKKLTPTIQAPEGITFDPHSQTFWILGLFDERIYHIGYKDINLKQ